MADEPTISDQVVLVGMESLTGLISYAHPDDVHLADFRDRATVIDGLKKLHDAGHELDPMELADWAVANNWRPKAAEELKDYAARINQGKAVRSATGTYSERLKPDIVESWRDEAEGRGRGA